MSPVSRRQCRWPECDERTGLVPIEGRDGRTYQHCGAHHVQVERIFAAAERILAAASQSVPARTRTKPRSRRRS